MDPDAQGPAWGSEATAPRTREFRISMGAPGAWRGTHCRRRGEGHTTENCVALWSRRAVSGWTFYLSRLRHVIVTYPEQEGWGWPPASPTSPSGHHPEGHLPTLLLRFERELSSWWCLQEASWLRWTCGGAAAGGQGSDSVYTQRAGAPAWTAPLGPLGPHTHATLRAPAYL